MKHKKARISAVLGPTNTGKTHYAIERMLGHRTGMFGLPLRLLAREVYERVEKACGAQAVALITGEERIIPKHARYWICTVEAMPLDQPVACVVIDEIQLCGDSERGHVFTDRLLNLRGKRETIFLGSQTMRPLIAKLVPQAQVMIRPRLSNLTYSGMKKLSRIPARSAIVAFSTQQVYAIAKLIRRCHGGAAVVLGALSPRTRNAQVDLYQSGQVDYLVATDAIGMGLNLDINHVAFAKLSKFDGQKMRALAPSEMGQIAGRAGRYMNDGTFGVTYGAAKLKPDMVKILEEHHVDPLQSIYWRNSQLDFASSDKLISSLEAPPPCAELNKITTAQDQRSFQELVKKADIIQAMQSGEDVRLLWQCCGIPDFAQLSFGAHCDLISAVFYALRDDGVISEDWIAQRVGEIDNIQGGIDALSKRVALIRSYTYIAQRNGWLSDENYWRAHTRAIEDRLSDALHNALTQKFIDRRSSILRRRSQQRGRFVAQIDTNGRVTVEGEFFGKLEGFRFQVDQGANRDEVKRLRQAALEALKPELLLRSERMYRAPDTEFEITDQGNLIWGEALVGKLSKGDGVLTPALEVFVDDEIDPQVSEKVTRRLRHFVDRKIQSTFEALIAMRDDAELDGLARGFAFRLSENLGVISRSAIAQEVKELDQVARGKLRKHGVRFGQYTVFQKIMLKPAPTRLRLLLWAIFEALDEFPTAPPPGLVTIPASQLNVHKGYYIRAGYRIAGKYAVRIDMLERLADLIRNHDVKKGFEATPDMLSITGTTGMKFADLMKGLGFNVQSGERKKSPRDTDAPQDSAQSGEDEEVMETYYIFKWLPKARSNASRPPRSAPRKKKDRQNIKAKPAQKGARDPNNPFAALSALKG